VRKILVPLSGQWDEADPEDLDRVSLRAGFDVARRFDAHVEVFCMEVLPKPIRRALAPWVPGGAIDSVLNDIEAASDARRRRARATFEAVAREAEVHRQGGARRETGFSVEFVEHLGDVRASLAVRSRLADLTVTAHAPDGAGWFMPQMLEVALQESGRPVLVVSPQVPNAIGGRIVIAWNGTAEASRAVALSHEFISGADDVVVLVVEEEPGAAIQPSARDVAEFLGWHGITVRTRIEEVGDRATGDAILEAIADERADLVIMGTYMRERLRRLVCGDVTRAVYGRCSVPVLSAG
jgi:nucleotide-binding universal stress UspA family protein